MGLAGAPVRHSISPYIHNAAFESKQFDGVYLPFEVRDVSSFIKRMIHPRTRELNWNFLGLSVTAHKDPSWIAWTGSILYAQEIGAVNTVLVRGDELPALTLMRTLCADNPPHWETFADGAVQSLSGGVANAATWVLSQKGAEVTIFARDAEKASVLAKIQSSSKTYKSGFVRWV